MKIVPLAELLSLIDDAQVVTGEVIAGGGPNRVVLGHVADDVVSLTPEGRARLDELTTAVVKTAARGRRSKQDARTWSDEAIASLGDSAGTLEDDV